MSVINIPADETVSTSEIGDSSVATATLKASYPQNVAVSSDGGRAYVTDGNTSVWVVDTQSRAVVATIPARSAPEDVVISPDGKNVYVTAQLRRTTVRIFRSGDRYRDKRSHSDDRNREQFNCRFVGYSYQL
jgi:YVTN family beta-propeller protein